MQNPSILPSLYVRGTFYQIGFDVGKTFKLMIEEYVAKSTYLHDTLIPAYNTKKGRAVYENCVNSMKTKFPHYVKELEGTAAGSQTPFHMLMLIHIDNMILDTNMGYYTGDSGNGCSSILCNKQDVVLGHTEDAKANAVSNCYVIHADISDTDEDGEDIHEKFSSFCYAGNLPGFCMSVNKHGFVYTMNLLNPIGIHPYKTPRHFLTRALLSAKNLDEALTILRDPGTGSAQGFNINMAFLKTKESDGSLVLHSVEVGPSSSDELMESQLSHLTVPADECHVRCNRYLRLKIDDDRSKPSWPSSTARLKVMNQIGLPSTIGEVIALLSNTDDPDYPIFRQGTTKDDGFTVATGIFDLTKNEWRVYVNRALKSKPIAIFPLEL